MHILLFSFAIYTKLSFVFHFCLELRLEGAFISKRETKAIGPRPKNWSLRFYLVLQKMVKNISIHHLGFYCFQLNKKCDLFLLSKFATFKIVKRCGSMIQILKHFLKVDIVAYTWITFLFQLQNRFFFLFLLGSWSFFCRVK